jgi:putative ABC transport system permease protein
LPALQAARGHFGEVAHGARGVTASKGATRSRSALVVFEVALSLVLLVSAALLIRSFSNLTRVDLGVRTDHVLTFMMTPTPKHLQDAEAAAAFYQRALERVAAQPGIEAAGGANSLPPTVLQRVTGFAIHDEPGTAIGDDRSAAFVGATPDYFRALGITVVRGRVFAATDRTGGPPVVILNRSLAQRLFPGGDAVGQRIRLISPNQSPDARVIVGVVGDVKYQGLELRSPDTIYTPYAQTAFPWLYGVVRTRGEPLAMAGAVRRAIAELDGGQPVMQLRSMDQLVWESVAQPRFEVTLVGLFAGLALLLAVVGLYGVIAYLVAQRTQEIGIRIALGAQRRDVLQLVVGHGLKLVAVGLVLGIAGALAVTRLLRDLLFEVSATDPLVFVIVPITFALVALVASWLPARRAASVDPMIALRDE